MSFLHAGLDCKHPAWQSLEAAFVLCTTSRWPVDLMACCTVADDPDRDPQAHRCHRDVSCAQWSSCKQACVCMQVTQLFSQYVVRELEEFAKAPAKAWRSKDVAIYLVTALTVQVTFMCYRLLGNVSMAHPHRIECGRVWCSAIARA